MFCFENENLSLFLKFVRCELIVNRLLLVKGWRGFYARGLLSRSVLPRQTRTPVDGGVPLMMSFSRLLASMAKYSHANCPPAMQSTRVVYVRHSEKLWNLGFQGCGMILGLIKAKARHSYNRTSATAALLSAHRQPEVKRSLKGYARPFSSILAEAKN